jgi:hypothetical protein
MRRPSLALALLLSAACATERSAPASADLTCFGTRILSYRDLVAEVVIPSGESCESGTFQMVFTRGADTLQVLTETRSGTVGLIGTADVDGDGRGEFFVTTQATDSSARGTIYAYTDGTAGITRFTLAPLSAEQLTAYTGGDRFGFGGADQLVRAYPIGAAGDTAWFGYSHGEQRWNRIERPDWVR